MKAEGLRDEPVGYASKRMGAQIDGFMGTDVLSEFRAVLIDYKADTLELEQ